MKRSFKTTMAIMLLLAVAGLTFSQEGKSSKQSAGKEIVAEGIGAGETRQDALHDAMRKAIEKAVGLYVVSQRTVTDQELKEKIVVTSDAVVTNYKELDSFERNGIWTIKIEAKVLPNEYLKYAPRLQAQTVTASEIGNLVNKLNTYQNAEEMIYDIFDDTFYARLFPIKKESIEISSKVDLNTDTVPLKINFAATIDQTEFEKFQKRLSSVLDQIALQKIKVVFNNVNIDDYEDYSRKEKLFDLQQNLLNKAGHSKKDDELMFVAFRNYKATRMYYILYLVPKKIASIIINSVRDDSYVSVSLRLSDKKILRKKFRVETSWFCYRDFGDHMESELQRPITFSNKMRIVEPYFGTVGLSIEKSGRPIRGSLTSYVSKTDLKNIQNVFIYLFKTDDDDDNQKNEIIESQLWTTE